MKENLKIVFNILQIEDREQFIKDKKSPKSSCTALLNLQGMRKLALMGNKASHHNA